MKLSLLSILLLVAPAISSKVSRHEARLAEQIYMAHAVHADVAAGIGALDSSFPTGDMRRIVGYRFDKRPTRSTADAFGEVLFAYQLYWHRSLLTPNWRWLYAFSLKASLYQLLADNGIATTDVGYGVESLLWESGIGSIAKKSVPLLDFVAWKSQRAQTYQVELTEETREVNVIFIGDLISHGWMDYATMGKMGTGGWVADDTVFCIEDQYDTSSERFNVSFLKHEARHLADLRKNPRLSPLMLEYRAKLTELANADLTLTGIIEAMESRATSNGATVHARADYEVVSDMRQKLGCFDECTTLVAEAERQPQVFRRAARALLAASAP